MDQMINTLDAMHTDDCYVEVINHGSFNSHFTIQYSYNNSNFTINSKLLLPSMLEKIVLKDGATNVNVNVIIDNTDGSQTTLYNKIFPNCRVLKLLLEGTELSPQYTDISNNGNEVIPDLKQYYVSVSNIANFKAKVTAQYTLNNKIFNKSSDTFSNKHTANIFLPTNSTNIQVTVKIKTQTSAWQIIYTNTLDVAKILTLTLSGTIDNPVCTDTTLQGTITSPTVQDPTFSVSNNGSFVSMFILSYDSNELSTTVNSNNFANGVKRQTIIPIGATNIEVLIYIMDNDNSWINIYDKTFDTPNALNLNLTGTIDKPVCSDVTNPPDVGNPNTPPNLKLVKAPNKSMAGLNETITFMIKMATTNDGTATNIILKDIIPNEAKFITDSLKLNGDIIKGNTFPSDGVNITSLSQGDSVLVTYQVEFTSMPATNPVSNQPTANYNYIDSSGASTSGSVIGTVIPLNISSNSNCCCGCMPCMCCCNSSSSYMENFSTNCF